MRGKSRSDETNPSLLCVLPFGEMGRGARKRCSRVLRSVVTRASRRCSDVCFIAGYGGVAPCPEHFAKPNALPYAFCEVYVLVPFAARHDHHEEPCCVLMDGSPPEPEFPTHLQ